VKKVTHYVFGFAMLLGSASFIQPAMAQEEPQSGSFAQLLKCRPLTDVAKKAACYDAAMDSIQKVAQGGKVNIVTETQINNLERDAFGFNLPNLPKLRLPGLGGIQKHAIVAGNADKQGAGAVIRKDKKGEIVKITFDLKRMETRPNRRMRFILTNGQTWLQTDNSQIRVPPKRAKFVEIKKAAMGSYFLLINGEKNAIRVKREN
jgi:hypothetical protein